MGYEARDIFNTKFEVFVVESAFSFPSSLLCLKSFQDSPGRSEYHGLPGEFPEHSCPPAFPSQGPLRLRTRSRAFIPTHSNAAFRLELSLGRSGSQKQQGPLGNEGGPRYLGRQSLPASWLMSCGHRRGPKVGSQHRNLFSSIQN